PYWFDIADTVELYPFTGTAETFFPLLPITLTASEAFADDSVTISGDLETWPVWDITGPCSSVTLRNLSTGEVLTSDAFLAGSEVMTIDTRPGAKTVTRQDGSNLYPTLSTTSVMWPLRRGLNAIRVEMGGAATGSNIQLSYRTRYLSP
ncbi:MAG: phage distal tail protein, partial [Candidatus Binatia bacterium]